MTRTVATFALLLALAAGCDRGNKGETAIVVSVLGTNDVHGALLPTNGNYGLALLGGYAANLRAAREADGGAVLLIDAGDMWQGTIESNVTEGAAVVAAFNAAGYDAAAVGNHEFDFGPAGAKATPTEEGDDPRVRSRRARRRRTFPCSPRT